MFLTSCTVSSEIQPPKTNKRKRGRHHSNKISGKSKKAIRGKMVIIDKKANAIVAINQMAIKIPEIINFH